MLTHRLARQVDAAWPSAGPVAPQTMLLPLLRRGEPAGPRVGGSQRQQRLAQSPARTAWRVASLTDATPVVTAPRLDDPTPGFDSIADALVELRAGNFLVVLDDEDRENEGDLIVAADRVTAEKMAYMVEHTSGVVCIAMQGRDLERLRLPLMVRSAENEEAMYTAFTITVDLRKGISTGISAADRAATIRALADPSSRPEDFIRPGHIFPLRCRQEGVLVRPGHTEAAVDLARLAGCYPAGVLCEIVDRTDGSMARTPKLVAMAKQHGLKCITIADLIRYRLMHEQLVKHTSQQRLATRHGDFTAHVFASVVSDTEHLVLATGQPSPASSQQPPLVYIHEESALADVLGSSPLDAAMLAVQRSGWGAVVYVRNQAAQGLRLSDEVRQLSGYTNGASSNGASSSSATAEAHHFTETQRTGLAAASKKESDYAAAAQMLKHLGMHRVRLMEADGQQAHLLARCGLDVTRVAGPAPTGKA